MLLKNENQVLPLKPEKKIAVIGDFARKARYQGAGSSNVNCIRQENVMDLIDQYPITVIGFAQGYQRDRKKNVHLEEEALSLAKQADQILFFFGLDEISEVEGMDRPHMRVPENQLALLQKLAKLGKEIIGVLSGGSAIEMPWESCCSAIIHGYLGGEAGAGAMLQALTGQVNPSGKLNETYPMKYEDTPAYHYCPAKFRDSQYRESIFVGYRYYNTVGTQVRYPFGYGLSYTNFDYSDFSLTRDRVTFTLTNNGDRDGAEVAQVYVGCLSGKIFRPAIELKGFAKVFLRAGESQTVTIPLDDKAFRYWNVKTGQWEVEGADYRVMVGASSEDIRLQGTIAVPGSTDHIPYSRSMLASYYTGQIRQVPDEEYAALMGGQIPEERRQTEMTVNDALCQMGDAKSGFARFVYRILTSIKVRNERKGKPNLNLLFIYNIPFRGIAKMTNGIVSMKMAEGMVTAVNGHFWRGIGCVLRGFVANAKANKEFSRKLFGESGQDKN